PRRGPARGGRSPGGGASGGDPCRRTPCPRTCRSRPCGRRPPGRTRAGRGRRARRRRRLGGWPRGSAACRERSGDRPVTAREAGGISIVGEGGAGRFDPPDRTVTRTRVIRPRRVLAG